MRMSWLAVLLTGVSPSVLLADPPRPQAAVATQPTDVLRAWEELEYGLFIHFGMSTFTGHEFGGIEATSKVYAPTDLDVDQWIRTARDAGMRYAVLTAKHHYGHALWPSAVSDYTVATSSQTTDVIEQFVEACRKYKLAPGFYYSLGWDKYHQLKRTPIEYERFVHEQMRELLTRYGPITEMWFDIPWDMGPDMPGMLTRLYDHCKSLQPDCLVLLNQGFVDGSQVNTREPSYAGKIVSQIPMPIWPKDLNNGERVAPRRTGHNPGIVYNGTRYYIPDEVCDSLGQTRWFWGRDDDVRPARQMVELYRRSVGRGANLLLNAGPDRSGRIPPEFVARLMETAELIGHPEGVRDSLLIDRPVAASNVYRNEVDKWGPSRATDMDLGAEGGTRWATDVEVKTAWLEVDLGAEAAFSRATISEFLDAVRAFELQVPDEQGGWNTVHRGGTIGGPGVEVTFPPVKAGKVRLAITDSTGGPTIWDFAVYPPR
ncbi:MAG TPA: alpha-L-fucosidase [Phycisphaerae bacterium]|nr:alpha-L-fucosidase [Phycisphaerae bacterium]HRY66520.1 alpha-L-fucosidase [Phycisphaerae bacterium]HSA28632.1 alpha-L-fucosidase [Phycisphaerae bacterium]